MKILQHRGKEYTYKLVIFSEIKKLPVRKNAGNTGTEKYTGNTGRPRPLHNFNTLFMKNLWYMHD